MQARRRASTGSSQRGADGLDCVQSVAQPTPCLSGDSLIPLSNAESPFGSLRTIVSFSQLCNKGTHRSRGSLFQENSANFSGLRSCNRKRAKFWFGSMNCAVSRDRTNNEGSTNHHQTPPGGAPQGTSPGFFFSQGLNPPALPLFSKHRGSGPRFPESSRRGIAGEFRRIIERTSFRGGISR